MFQMSDQACSSQSQEVTCEKFGQLLPNKKSQNEAPSYKKYKKSSNNLYSCTNGTCDYVTDRLFNLQRHEKQCPGMPLEDWKKKEVTCETCGQLFTSKKSRMRHQQNAKYCVKQKSKIDAGIEVSMYKYRKLFNNTEIFEFFARILLILKDIKVFFWGGGYLEGELTNVCVYTWWFPAAAKGRQKSPHICLSCGKLFAYQYVLRNHLARSLSCQVALAPMPVDVTFSEYPPSPFGTTEYFEFCERLPLECVFSFDEWQGPQENPIVHLGSLLQHGIPLLWKGGANHCPGIKLPKVDRSADFPSEVQQLLMASNLTDPEQQLDVKSAKIGTVSLSLSFCKNAVSFLKPVSIIGFLQCFIYYFSLFIILSQKLFFTFFNKTI